MLKNLIPESKKLYGVTIADLLDKFLKFEGKTLIMFDLETLGLNPKYEYEQITEVAAWAIRGEDFKILDKLNYKVNLSESATTLLDDPNSLERANWERRQRKRGKSAMNDPNDILKMTRYHTIDSQIEEEATALEKFIQFVNEYPNPVLVAHNAKFDIKFVEARGARCGVSIPPLTEVLDTLKISRYFLAPTIQTLVDTDEDATKLFQSLLRQRGNLIHISSRLGELARAFEIDAKYWHTANADVEMMLGVLLKMVKFLEKHHDVDIHKSQENAIARDVKQHQRPKTAG
jgi:DNA polymerase III epsilon subunit-like protein